jgi:hypothetical protein
MNRETRTNWEAPKRVGQRWALVFFVLDLLVLVEQGLEVDT